MNFESFLKNLGITQLNAMQALATKEIAAGKQVTLLAKTGTGKTLAYLLPLAVYLQKNEEASALVLVPSRELALQVQQTFRQMASGLKAVVCYGGHSVKEELNAFKEMPALIIGTPGRLAQHIEQQNFNDSAIKTWVIDEFDKCLELGFLNDISYIHRYLKNVGQTILTSATPLHQLPDFIAPENRQELDFLSETLTTSVVSYQIIRTKEKWDSLFKLLCFFNNQPAVVFANERAMATDLYDYLTQKGLNCTLYHGKQEQDVRERELLKFSNGTANILIATDLAGRGLDIPSVTHIVHFQLPINEQAFIHRNGRTARMHANGHVYMLLADDEKLLYVNESPTVFKLPDMVKLPPPSQWQTLYFSAGRKDKLSKADLLGFLIKTGGFLSQEVGQIDLKDRASYVAVNSEKLNSQFSGLLNQKMKGKKIKIELAK